MQRFWIKFHRISGLLILLPLLLQSIGGSILVFDHAIDERLNPALLLSLHSDDRQAAPISSIIHAVMTARPDIAHINSLHKPRHATAVYTAYVELKPGSSDHGKRIEVLVDPYTAEVTGIREWGRYFTSFVYSLHASLLLGHNGELLVGFVAILALLNLVLGVYLGWPKTIAAWNWLLARTQRKASLTANLRRWHIVSGLLSLPVFTIILLSGIGLAFPSATKFLFNSDVPDRADVFFIADKIIDIDTWLPAAQQHWPQAQWLRLTPPTEHAPATKILMRQPDDPRKTAASSVLWLHPQSSEVIAEQDYDQLSLRQKTAFWLFPLHNGEAFGLIGRIVVFLGAMVICLLTLVGGCLWYRRHYRI